MCRSIRTRFDFDQPMTEDEIRVASLQFLRKVSVVGNETAAVSDVAVSDGTHHGRAISFFAVARACCGRRLVRIGALA